MDDFLAQNSSLVAVAALDNDHGIPSVDASAHVYHHFFYSLPDVHPKHGSLDGGAVGARLTTTPPPSARFEAPSLTRSLTIAVPADSPHDMATETMPSSPPDLSSSKSSTKSSSVRSSSITNGDEINQLSHFEEILLHDTDANIQPRPPLKHRPLVRSSSPPSAIRPNKTGSVNNLRELTHGLRASPPANRPQGRGTPGDRPSPASFRNRGLKSAYSTSTPSLAIPNGPPKRFGPSPPRRTDSLAASAQSSPIAQSRPRLVGTHSGPPSRRQSWQPSRKSTQELEDEYHDSDEDLPEDAIVWNIPLSPRPLNARSPSASPLRQSPEGSPPNSRPTRTKSWSDAMMDLSEEAKILTSALEDHADDRENGDRSKENTSPPRPSPKKRAKSVLLPPTQSCNLMIDPLPPSKEKEKVLSRTRPSWLPPKSPQEEKRHLKEYQRMMSVSLEAERRREVREERARTSRETEKSHNARIWEEHVIPNWSTAVKEPRTRELWWAGITPRSRGKVWLRALGNELHLTEVSYATALGRAVALDQKFASFEPQDKRDIKELAWFSAIRSDASASFPELKIFQSPDGPLYQPLVSLLMAYAMYRSDVGHVHGAQLPAALLLLNMSPEEAFIALANLLNRPTPLACYLRDPTALAHFHTLILNALAYKLPSLHSHLTNSSLGLEPSSYMDPLLRTLFARGMGVDCVSRIWDVYMFEGENALVRAAVGVFARLERRLYGSAADILQVLGWDGVAKNGGLLDVGTEEELMAAMRWAGKVEVTDDD